MRDCNQRLQRLCGTIVLGLILVFLMGCAKPWQPCLKPHLEIPPTLTSKTWVPQFQGENNEALLTWAVAMRAALLSCNADKQAIKELSHE